MLHDNNDNRNMQDESNENIDKNAAARDTQNWDEREILNRDTQGQRPKNERRNLQADQEKRNGGRNGEMDPGRRD